MKQTIPRGAALAPCCRGQSPGSRRAITMSGSSRAASSQCDRCQAVRGRGSNQAVGLWAGTGSARKLGGWSSLPL